MRVRTYTAIAILAVCCAALGVAMELYREMCSAEVPYALAVIAADRDTIFFDVEIGDKSCIAMSAISTWYHRPLSVVTDGMHPRLSRTGDWMFFERRNGDAYEIWRRSISAANVEERLLHETDEVAIRDVSSDGGAIIVQIGRRSLGLGMIVEFRLFDTKTREYSNLDLGMGACFLGDGEIVIAQGDRRGLYRLDALGGETHLTKAGAFPVASVDGTKIVYLNDPLASPEKREWILLNLNDGEMRRLGRADNPVFSGDGDSLIITGPTASSTIWRYDIQTGSSHEIIKPPGYVGLWTTTVGGTAGATSGTPSVVLILDPSGKSLKTFFPVLPLGSP